MPKEKHSASLNRAKYLRKNQTEPELSLWYYLRAHRFFGLKFKRQKPIGSYVVDFVCLEKKLIIEVDGGQHNQQRLADDRVRDEWLSAHGFKVLRFWNSEVLSDTSAVLEKIRLTVECGLPSPPSPLPHAGEGGRSGA